MAEVRVCRVWGWGIAGFLLILTCCGAVLAQIGGSREAETQVFSMGEIVVTAEREALAANVYELTAEEIESKNAKTVAEALDFVPGVWVTVGKKNEPDVTLRGFKQERVLVLLDGVPIANPYYGYADLGQEPVGNIAKIKVVKGPVSPLYGANALGGVINIITKQPGRSPRLELAGGLSNQNSRDFALSYGTRIDELSLWLSGSRRQSDGFRLSGDFEPAANENGGLRENSDYEKNSLSVNLVSRPDEVRNTAFSFSYVDNQGGMPPHVSSPVPQYWRFTTWKRWTAALAGETELTQVLSAKGRVFYDKYDNVLKGYRDDSYTTLRWTSTYDDYTLGSSIYLDLDSADSRTLRAAVNLKKDVHRGQGNTGGSWLKSETNTYSLGVEEQYKPLDSITLLTAMSYNVMEKQMASSAKVSGEMKSFDWLLTAAYTSGWGGSLHGSLSQKTRFPTMFQLFDDRSGDADLKEQTSISYELGIRYAFTEQTRGELCYFRNEIKNLIDRTEKGGSYFNTPEVTIGGLEAGLYFKVGRSISVGLTHTYLDARDKKPEVLERSDSELPWTPRHKSDLKLQYAADFGLFLDLLGSHIDKRYYYDDSGAQHHLKEFWLWRGKVSQRIGSSWEASIAVDNLLDVDCQEEEGYPQPGRTGWLELKFGWEGGGN